MHCTRWTNLYFPSRLIVIGDLIGGKLAPVFGSGVRDEVVKTKERWGLFTHTLYWSLTPGSTSEHIRALRKALDLADDLR